MMVFILFCLTLIVNTAYSSSEELNKAIDAVKKTRKFIGSTTAEGIFSLGTLKNTLYAGGYCWDNPRNLDHDGSLHCPSNAQMIYRLSGDSLNPVYPGLTDIEESVCKLIEFKDHLYANSEDGHGGKIYRSADGSIWNKVWDNNHYTTGCGFAVFKGSLYATATNKTNGGIIVRSSTGNKNDWKKVYEDPDEQNNYIREIVAYNNKLYAFMVGNDDGLPYYISSTDGKKWSPTRIKMTHRVIRAYSSDFNTSLWLATSKKHTRKEKNGTSVILEMQRWQEPKDDKDFPEVYTTNRMHIGNITSTSPDLFFSVVPNDCCGKRNEWPPGGGSQHGAILLMSDDDTSENWVQIDTLSSKEAWGIKVIGKYLYVGTSGGEMPGHENTNGLYRYDISEIVKLKREKLSALPATYNMIHKDQQ